MTVSPMASQARYRSSGTCQQHTDAKSVRGMLSAGRGGPLGCCALVASEPNWDAICYAICYAIYYARIGML